MCFRSCSRSVVHISSPLLAQEEAAKHLGGSTASTHRVQNWSVWDRVHFYEALHQQDEIKQQQRERTEISLSGEDLTSAKWPTCGNLKINNKAKSKNMLCTRYKFKAKYRKTVQFLKLEYSYFKAFANE